MKIAIIEPVGGHGGMDYYDYGLAQGLGVNAEHVYYFTSSKTKKRKYANVTTLLTFSKVWETSNKLLRLFYFLKGFFSSFKKAKKLNASVIHLQFFDLGLKEFLVIILLSFFNFKKVLTLHDVSSFKNDNISFLEKWILNRFDQVIVHNNLSKNELIKKDLPKERVNIVPHGNYLPFVNQLNYNPSNESKLELLFFGQIKKVKGLEILLKALSIASKKTTKIHLTIAGRPWHDREEKYLSLIEELGIKNIVTTNFTYIPDKEVEGYFKKCDVIVLPYKKIYQSGVLLLSMSYGRVVLASNLTAFKEVIEHGKTGFLFEKNNEYDLARQILEISNNKQQLIKMKNLASKVLETNFDWGKIGKQTIKIYNKISK